MSQLEAVFDEAASLTPQEAAAICEEYHTLKDATRQAERRLLDLHHQLRQHIERTGEPLEVEGLPALRLKPRRGRWSWDLPALFEHEPVEFQRLLQLGCLTVVTSTADEQVAHGQITSKYREFGVQGQDTVLEFDR